MYDLAVEEVIAAAHQLKGYNGKCERCHGHSWRIRLEISATALDSLGLAVDFSVLKSLLRDVLAPFDHVMLNEVADFADCNPSSENLARIVFAKCRDAATQMKLPITVLAVQIWESPNASARYHE